MSEEGRKRDRCLMWTIISCLGFFSTLFPKKTWLVLCSTPALEKTRTVRFPILPPPHTRNWIPFISILLSLESFQNHFVKFKMATNIAAISRCLLHFLFMLNVGHLWTFGHLWCLDIGFEDQRIHWKHVYGYSGYHLLIIKWSEYFWDWLHVSQWSLTRICIIFEFWEGKKCRF